MALRDLPYADLVSVFVLEGRSSGIDAVAKALETVVRTRREARRQWPSSVLLDREVPVTEVPALAAASVLGDPVERPAADLAASARAGDFAGLPIRIVVAPTRTAVVFAHGVFDGHGALRLLGDLLDALHGTPLSNDVGPVRIPVARAVRTLRRAELRATVQSALRRLPRSRRSSPVAEAAPRGPSHPRSAAFTLGVEDVAAIRRWSGPGERGRATFSARLSAVLLRALQSVAADDRDLDVWSTLDLRHRVSGRVTGNFVVSVRLGRLRRDDWSPQRIAARTVALAGADAVVALATQWVRVVLRREGRPDWPSQILYLSVLEDPSTRGPRFDGLTVASLGPAPAAPFVFCLREAEAVFVSVWQEDDAFDLDRLEPALRRLLRTPA